MALDKPTLINRALARLGSAPIFAADEDTDLARAANAVYDDLLELCLGLHTWSFALRTVQLDRTNAAPINGWTTAYNLPGECMGGPVRVLADPKHPDAPLRRFALEAGLLYADEPALWAAFVFRAHPDTWSPVFRAAFMSGLAAWLAVPVSGNKDLRDLYHREAFGSAEQDYRGGLMGKAISRDIHGQPGPTPSGAAPDDLSRARFW